MIALWSFMLVATCGELVGFPSTGGVDACDTSCMECEAEKTGHHCPPGCPECHAHQGQVASLPSAPLSPLEPFPLRSRDVALTPPEAATPLQQFLSSIYRPPRSAARFG